MAIIHIDGKDYEVNGSDNLLHACLSLGKDLPYFCWHPELGSVGACRQCAVKQYRDANDKQGRPGDLEMLERMTHFLGPGKTFCAHAPGAMEPLQSALKYFRAEFEACIAKPAQAAA